MKELIAKIHELGIIQPGDHILRAGEKTNFYIDIKAGYRDPEFLPLCAQSLHNIVPANTTCVAGIGIGGIPIATAYHLIYHIPLSPIRNTQKDYGMEKQIEGYIPTTDDYVTILDDVFTTGSSITATAEILKRFGVKNIQACVIVERASPNLEFPVSSILTLKDLIK